VILSELHPAQLERASGATVGEFLARMRALGYRAQTLDGTPVDAGRTEITSVLFVQ
jgi:hypothetical protein